MGEGHKIKKFLSTIQRTVSRLEDLIENVYWNKK